MAGGLAGCTTCVMRQLHYAKHSHKIIIPLVPLWWVRKSPPRSESPGRAGEWVIRQVSMSFMVIVLCGDSKFKNKVCY